MQLDTVQINAQDPRIKKGHLAPKVTELIHVASDCATIRMHEPGLRVHLRNAFKFGAPQPLPTCTNSGCASAFARSTRVRRSLRKQSRSSASNASRSPLRAGRSLTALASRALRRERRLIELLALLAERVDLLLPPARRGEPGEGESSGGLS